MSDLGIVTDHQNGVTTLWLNNPPMNPIGAAQVAALQKLLPELAADKTVRAIVIRGALKDGATGANFSVGANLKEAHLAAESGPKAFVAQRVELYNQIETLEKPVIAAIQGYCLGGGLELAMACHFRVADDSAQLGLPEIDIGVAPLWGGVSHLLRLVGRANALDLLLLGRRIEAAEALSMNLLHRVASSDTFEHTLAKLAESLAAKAPLAVAALIRVVNRCQDASLAEGLAYELDELSPLAGTKDSLEGVTALFEKRQPVFTGE